jgi:hypothetical protein
MASGAQADMIETVSLMADVDRASHMTAEQPLVGVIIDRPRLHPIRIRRNVQRGRQSRARSRSCRALVPEEMPASNGPLPWQPGVVLLPVHRDAAHVRVARGLCH